MWLERLIRALGPVVSMAVAANAGRCDNDRFGGKFEFSGQRGVPLGDLDTSAAPPSAIILLGPDRLTIREGEGFALTAEGDATEALRFVRDGDKLGIMRENGAWKSDSAATITLTIPAPHKITMAGSGEIVAAALADDAEVVIAGSGRIEATALAVQRLAVTIAGSGNFHGVGTAEKLALTITGSGIAAMDALKVEKARIKIAGSGDAAFASDGEVDARIVGSGTVTVRGSASCSVKSMGSGKLVCERGAQAA